MMGVMNKEGQLSFDLEEIGYILQAIGESEDTSAVKVHIKEDNEMLLTEKDGHPICRICPPQSHDYEQE